MNQIFEVRLGGFREDDSLAEGPVPAPDEAAGKPASEIAALKTNGGGRRPIVPEGEVVGYDEAVDFHRKVGHSMSGS